MKNFNIQCFCVFVAMAIAQHLAAQPTLLKMKEKLQLQKTVTKIDFDFKVNPKQNNLATIHFSPTTALKPSDSKQWLTTQLQLRKGVDDLITKPNIARYPAMQVEKLEQYFKGIKVEHGIIKAASIGGKLAVMQMEFYSIPDNFTITPLLSEAAALQKAMSHINAKKYIWEAPTGNNPLTQKPKGAIVIVKDDSKLQDTICLAYKFNIVAEQPLTSAIVYVNAMDGSIALVQNQIDAGYTNKPAVATTLYSGSQTIYTDDYAKSINPPIPSHRLRQTRNDHDIETFDFGGEANTLTTMRLQRLSPTDISDASNAWSHVDDAATEVHFNMQLISDYWKTIHGRKSYDNDDATVASFLHVKLDNPANLALWIGGIGLNAMYFGEDLLTGDGINTTKSTGPTVGLDVTAHEIGHAIEHADDMPNFTSGRESGALNEGFSDIWGACLENYAISKFPALAANKKTWVMAEESTILHGDRGIRDMENPKSKEHPDTYYGTNFVDASKAGCTSGDCGVHENCTILTKWFYLITMGGTGTNDHNYTYTVAPLGFATSESIAYNTELLLTANSNYHAVMHTSINYSKAKYGETSNEATQVIAAWRAVGVLDTLMFDSPGLPTSVFNGVTDGFTCVAVGKDGQVWAGTSKKGLYKYNDKTFWQANPNSPENKVGYLDMKADKNGGIWAAQTGYVGGTSAPNSSGGIYYFDDTTFASKKHFTASLKFTPPRNVVSQNVRSLWIDNSTDNTTTQGKTLPMVWAVSLSNTTSSGTTSGAIVRGLNDDIQSDEANFSKIGTDYMNKVDAKTSEKGWQTIAGNAEEVWAYSTQNNEKSLSSWYTPPIYYDGSPCQIMRFNAKTGDSIGVYNSKTNPDIFNPFFTAKAMYFDVNGNKWIGQVAYGLIMLDKAGKWHTSASIVSPAAQYPSAPAGTFPDIIPSNNTIVNNNAITGDDDGNVYIGTNDGLIVYSGGVDAGNNPLEQYSSYKRYTIADGLPSNNIRGIAVDNVRHGVWLATDKGIVLWRFRGADRTISIVNINTQKCARDIEYTVQIKGQYYGGATPNELKIELSDANGSFINATEVRKLTFIMAGGQQEFAGEILTLPTKVPDGNNYKLRARTTFPEVIGAQSRPFIIKKQTTVVPAQGALALSANKECTDNQGWTHYYFDNNTPNDELDDTRLLSLKKNGNTLGTLNVGGFSVTVTATALAGSFSANQIISPLVTNPFVSMNRYWNVNVPLLSQPTSAVGVRFYYNTQDLQDVNGGIPYGPIDHTRLQFYKTNGNPNPTTPLTGGTYLNTYNHSTKPTDSTWVYTDLSNDIHQAEFEVKSFSGGGGGSTADGGPISEVVQPLKLLGFTGQLQNGQTYLQWQTSDEENVGYFDIERSGDGISFVKIAHKTAVGTGDNSYTLSDISPNIGINYYRLKIMDKDGEYAYSHIVKIAISQGALFVIRPNPVHNSFQIVGNNNYQKLQLSDISGRIIKFYTPQASNQYSVAGIAPGVYMLSVVLNKQIVTQKIVIQ